jgi:hypothetical protein
MAQTSGSTIKALADIRGGWPNCIKKSTYAQPVSNSVDGDWVLDEAEALLDMDGRRERLEKVVASLESGETRAVDHVTARDRIEKRIRDHARRARAPVDGSARLPEHSLAADRDRLGRAREAQALTGPRRDRRR